ncbi:hypothetical protein AVEN_25433-1 [Araneus ventricosus]|uniref:Uncharacterized protein n=1 Tax=Araneus ventricosus TaxID=182803 RepID=A0A4Y2NEH6_ARAVE|nr:hypothetical protein AVEN_172615-1 [Araneus ventricosus]GBN37828.1 hypothetical protein AVEN_25433-1 [Araneus ventricosus]
MAKIQGIRRAISDPPTIDSLKVQTDHMSGKGSVLVIHPKIIMKSVQKYVFKGKFKASNIVKTIPSPMAAPKSSICGIVDLLTGATLAFAKTSETFTSSSSSHQRNAQQTYPQTDASVNMCKVAFSALPRSIL